MYNVYIIIFESTYVAGGHTIGLELLYAREKDLNVNQ